MTARMKEVLIYVWMHSSAPRFWHRARSSGERVTLASLHRKGLLQRRARRGVEGDADAAYEYACTETGKRVCVELGRLELERASQ